MPKKLKKQLKRSSRRLLNSSTSVDNEITEGDNGANQSAIVSPPREEEGAPQPQPRPQQQQPQPLPSYRRPGDFLQGLLSRGKRGLASGGASMGVSLGGRGGGKGAAASAGDTGDAATDPPPPLPANRDLRHCNTNVRAPPPRRPPGPPPAASASSSTTSPRSPPDPNKPLPSPPPPPTAALHQFHAQFPSASLSISTSVSTSTPTATPSAASTVTTPRSNDANPLPSSNKPNPVLKLERIMSTLTESEIEKLFSGAPQYFARSEGHCAGAPNPSVAFPFDEELEIRDLTDHVQIEDKAWSACTAWPHLTRDLNRDVTEKQKAQKHRKAHFFIRCRERPNMLSMSGLEKGTMGYQAALEISVGDVLEEEQFGFESVGKKNQVIVEARERMCSTLGALRRLPETEILDRLKRNGELYRENDLRKRTSVQTYQDLFHTFLRPINTVVDKRDHYSLTNQINALLKCLGTSNVWFDFTHVEWRIRLGQILWGEEDGDDLEDATHIHDATSAKDRAEEKYWLLMQILVSTELLIRLDAVTEGEEYGVEAFRPVDVVHFERAATRPVKWSLHLARSWLDNIDLEKVEGTPTNELQPPLPATSWLSSLVSKVSFRHREQEAPPAQTYTYTIKGRHGQRQVDGLTHFAKKLRWPGIDTYEARIVCNMRNAAKEKKTPTGTSQVKKHAKRLSWFGQWDVSSGSNKYDQVQTQRRKLAAALHTSGWLSKSFVFGLMLPGEGMYHYLMATLLENDSEAMNTLGPYANLCGGFVYGGKSFWSTSCIVGRVIAAGKGSAECMGWVSSDILPVGLGDGWVNIEVEDVAEDLAHLGKKARLWAKKRIEKESNILGDADELSVLPADFIIPHENNYSTPPPRVEINLSSLELLAPANNIQKTPFNQETSNGRKSPELFSYPANVHFAVSVDGGLPEEFSFSLSYDISFVTAHPCAPSQRVRFLKSPTSPTIQQIDVFGSEMLGMNARPAHRTGHPLHKYYNYTVIHISELLKKQHTPLSELLNSPIPNNPGFTTSRNGANRVLVIDCITNYAEVPGSPTLERLTSKYNIVQRRGSFPAAAQMHFESRKRQFGSDMEILVRALCAQKGWNAIISRRKRGCLACAIREAGALQWKVIVRVE